MRKADSIIANLWPVFGTWSSTKNQKGKKETKVGFQALWGYMVDK